MEKIKAAVLADIHSNLPALNACIEDAESKGVFSYIVLGDIINIWHKPNECIERIRKLTPFTVMGLSEKKTTDVKNFYDLWHLYDENASLIWTYNNISIDNSKYISSLPKALSINYGNIRMLALHGSAYSIEQKVFYESDDFIDSMLLDVQESIVICAGTHSQRRYDKNGKTVIDPGSVGCHHNKNRCAEYAILELSDTLDNVDFVQVEYGIEDLFSDYINSGLYTEGCFDAYIEYYGMRTGEDLRTDFRNKIDKARSGSVYTLSGPVPNDIYNQVYNDNYSEKITSEIFLPLEQ